MSVKERLILYAESQYSNVSKFEKACDLSNGYINSIVNSVGLKALNKILEVNPKLNKTWLIFGEGQMILEDRNKKIKPSLKAENQSAENKATEISVINIIAESNKLLAESNRMLAEANLTLVKSNADIVAVFTKGALVPNAAALAEERQAIMLLIAKAGTQGWKSMKEAVNDISINAYVQPQVKKKEDILQH